MPARLTKLFRKTCLHEHTIVVRSPHVERRVCEGCGYLSFSMGSDESPGESGRPRAVLHATSATP